MVPARFGEPPSRNSGRIGKRCGFGSPWPDPVPACLQGRSTVANCAPAPAVRAVPSVGSLPTAGSMSRSMRRCGSQRPVDRQMIAPACARHAAPAYEPHNSAAGGSHGGLPPFRSRCHGALPHLVLPPHPRRRESVSLPCVRQHGSRCAGERNGPGPRAGNACQRALAYGLRGGCRWHRIPAGPFACRETPEPAAPALDCRDHRLQAVLSVAGVAGSITLAGEVAAWAPEQAVPLSGRARRDCGLDDPRPVLSQPCGVRKGSRQRGSRHGSRGRLGARRSATALSLAGSRCRRNG